MRNRLKNAPGTSSWTDEPAPEMTLRHSGESDDVAEVTTASAPSATPTIEQLEEIVEALRAAKSL